MGELGHDYAALHQEVGASAEDGWALTQGQWRLVYNDCPHYGNTNILEVVSTDAGSGPSVPVACTCSETTGGWRRKRKISIVNGVLQTRCRKILLTSWRGILYLDKPA